jgi:hypothetical protein
MRMWLGLALSILMGTVSLVKSVFFTGSETGRIEEHLRSIDARMDRDELEFARRGEMQTQIDMLKDLQRMEEQNLRDQRQQIEDRDRELRKPRYSQ